jgi:hypothetical protein
MRVQTSTKQVFQPPLSPRYGRDLEEVLIKRLVSF